MEHLGLGILVITMFVVCAAKDVSVPTESGSYIGREAVNVYGEVYHAFLGVRFARAARFAKPIQEPLPTGIYNATYHRDGCIQTVIFGDGHVEGDEDCLFLDIYAPTDHSPRNSKPVMVWIHGGGFVTGAARQFDSSSLAVQGDVIVVVMQYRLGPFGFISTADDVLAGNYGLWDQLTALKWVKDNIVHFGGNPESVTIFGNSAGACSVNIHLVSTKSKGLFHRAISQSSYPCIKRNPVPVTYELAKMVNCYPASLHTVAKKTRHASIKQCLQRIDARQLCNVSWPLAGIKYGVMDFLYSPTVDKEFISNHLYDMLADPEYLQRTSFSNADILMAVNNAEGGAFPYIARNTDRIYKTSDGLAFSSLKAFQSQIVIPYIQGQFGIESEELVNTLTFEYVYPLNFTETINKDPAVKFIGNNFVTSATDMARAHWNIQGSGKTFLYLFDHDQKLAHYTGMIHGFDLVYTFGFNKAQLKTFTGSVNTTISPSERRISRALISILTSFAKTGNPNTSPYVEGWLEFSNTLESYLALSSNMSVRQHLYPRVTSLWRNLVPRLVRSAKNRTKPVTDDCQINDGGKLMSHSLICLVALFSLVIT